MELPVARAVASRIDVLAESGSTNADLRLLAADEGGWPHLSALITTNQTAGRGRLDRVWTAPPGTALAASVLLRRLPSAPESRGWIPLIAGLAMAEALAAQLPSHKVGLKWPNDVLVDGRKICGVLAEAAGDAVIVGAGVNTAMPAELLPVPTATSFAVLGAEADVDRLLADWLRRLDVLLDALAGDDPVGSGLHRSMTERCLTLGRDVRVSLPGGGELIGRAQRLDTDGRLVVAADGRENAVSAGDVVHVRPVGG